ncbi:SprT family zinc-dependent metalloprotease [Marivita sp. GX14005]|uniref:M48 family metallopeptidase n=1 Tax=Marivita sp. GX14005 TaxID=2942276 RepID=UPI002018972A|nr:SprT family zinc-dependent metalloprotease [Marivita sp. GX14005]MCL3882038.1 M48 family metallopeptidase [Marivita sp. GX14005]
MGVRTLPGNPDISISLRRNARSKRMTLRVSRIDGAVTLTVPRGISDREALDFAVQQENWLHRHLSTQPAHVPVGPGTRLTVAGVPMTVEQGTGKRLRAERGRLSLAASDRALLQLRAWLAEQARAELRRASDRYAAVLGRDYSRLTLRDPRSRWGSCSSAGALMYSWRLILAPRFVMDYVAAHEVAHLAEMNHSPAFWALVERLYGPHEKPRDWLRREGPGLHRFRFEA